MDFSNAFNSIKRDTMLSQVFVKIPEVFRVCFSAYSCTSFLKFGSRLLLSSEGVQQGDPIGPLLFCLTLQPILNTLSSELRLAYLDDITLGGNISQVTSDIASIRTNGSVIGLSLNDTKCEIISHFGLPSAVGLNSFIHVTPADSVLLGAPLLPGAALDNALSSRHAELAQAKSRLCQVTAHDALVLLKSSLSTPKLQHILRSSPCSGHQALNEIDSVLRSSVSEICNTVLSDTQWAQASLPVKAGGLGIRRSSHVAPSAFLASNAAT